MEAADTAVLALLEPLGPSPELVQALSDLTYDTGFGGRPNEAVVLANRALEIAEGLGLPRPYDAVGRRGWARCELGDEGGLADMREALALAGSKGAGDREIVWYNNLAVWLAYFDGPATALQVLDAGCAKAKSYGFRNVLLGGLIPNTLNALLDLGELDRAQSMVSDAVLGAQAMEMDRYVLRLRSTEVWIHALRGEGVSWLDWLETTARQHEASEFTVVGLGGAAVLRTELGQDHAALSLLAEVNASPCTRKDDDFVVRLPGVVRAAVRLGQPELAERLAHGCEFRTPRSDHTMAAVNAALAESRGQPDAAAAAYADAAERCAGFGMVVEQAFALLGEGRCLLELSQPAQAVEPLRRARATFVKIGARPALADTDVLLEQATALTA